VVAQQLRDRLNAVFSDAPWQQVSAAGGAAGRRINDVKTLIVHETSGWPPRDNGRDMFMRHFVPPPPADRLTTQLYISGDGTVLQGMELPNSTQHAGFTNGWALGSETGHGWGNYADNDHVGPFTSTDETKVPNPHPPPAMIPSATFGALIAPHAKPGNLWITMSGDGTIADAAADDLPGIKFFVRHQAFNEVVFGMWTTARYPGPWRQPQRVPEMLFTEPQYRAWALLARWIAEEFLLPRNFPLLPHKTRTSGEGTAGDHGVLNDAASFSAIVLADEGLSRSPTTFDLPAAPVPPTAESLQRAYNGPRPANVNPRWQSMFNVFRGFHGHGFCGDPRNGDHDCPGPMFDWHRFAREVWDWWWFPFDFNPTTPNAAVAARPYSLLNRDGSTPLKEYFWSTPVATPRARGRQGIHGAHGTPQTFELPEGSRVYAVANGELVAARFPAETGDVSLAFMLVRHEVFHRLDARPPAPGAGAVLPVFANRIDYDVAPTSVYSLYMHLGRPAAMSFDAVVDGNPDWLNRVLARKKEAQLGVDFHASAAAAPIPAAKWNDRPPSTVGRRPTLLEGWVADNNGLTTFLNTLRAGNLAIVPLDADATPIRILLGDFLANAGVISRDHVSTRRGVRVELFTTALISNEFMPADTSAAGTGWSPAIGVGSPAIRYQSEWARNPTAAELPGLQVAGVDPTLINWWANVQLATLNARFPADARLDAQGVVVHYDVLDFLQWLNARTWRSEWPKYRANDPAGGTPAAPRPR
jgi:hypothetical protein